MMAAFTVTVDDKDAQAMLARVGQLAGGSEKIFKKVALAAKKEVYNAFRFEQSPDGTPWPGLSPLTLKARAEKGIPGTDILRATHRMYDSTEAENTATEAIVSVGQGLPDARAWYSQFGTRPHVIRPKNKRALAWPGGPGPRAKVNHPGGPARAFLPINTMGAARPTEQWLAAVMDPIRKALEEATA